MPAHKLKTLLITYPLDPPSLIDRLREMFEVRPPSTPPRRPCSAPARAPPVPDRSHAR